MDTGVDLVGLLGIQIGDALSILCAKDSQLISNEIGGRIYVVLSNRSMELISTPEGRVIVIHLHSAEHGQGGYAGRLPEGINFSDSRNDILRKLGRPARAGGGIDDTILGWIPVWDKYVRHNFLFQVFYSEDQQTVCQITIELPGLD